MKKVLSKKSSIITISIIVLLVFVYAMFSKNTDTSKYDTATAQVSDLTYKVSVTGNIVPTHDVDLAFEQSGTISHVYAQVGDKVYRGQKLVALGSSDVYSLLLGAESDLETQKAVLVELKAGTREEEVAIYKAKQSSAEVAFVEAQTDANHKIADAFTRCDDAVRNNIDQLFSNPRSTSPALNVTATNQQLKIEIESKRLSVEEMLNNWSDESSNIGLDTTLQYVEEVKVLLDKISLAVNALTASGSLTQTTIDGYKADVSLARTSVNLAITNLNTVKEKLTVAESALLVAKKELELKKSGATAEQLSVQEAKVKSAEAVVSNYQAQLAKRVLYAPFSGTITRQDAEVGEIAGTNVTLVSLVSNSGFEIESFIPEADIAKVEVGDSATFDLDAYESDLVFSAHVHSIEPAETIIEGVSTYKAILKIDNTDKRIMFGMTANVEIVTDRRDEVMVVPSRAIITKDTGEKYVRILDSESNVSEQVVETGLRGSEGMTEILDGLKTGDEVVTFERE